MAIEYLLIHKQSMWLINHTHRHILTLIGLWMIWITCFPLSSLMSSPYYHHDIHDDDRTIQCPRACQCLCSHLKITAHYFQVQTLWRAASFMDLPPENDAVLKKPSRKFDAHAPEPHTLTHVIYNGPGLW